MREKAIMQIVKALMVTIVILTFLALWGWVGRYDYQMEMMEAGYTYDQIK